MQGKKKKRVCFKLAIESSREIVLEELEFLRYLKKNKKKVNCQLWTNKIREIRWMTKPDSIKKNLNIVPKTNVPKIVNRTYKFKSR